MKALPVIAGAFGGAAILAAGVLVGVNIAKDKPAATTATAPLVTTTAAELTTETTVAAAEQQEAANVQFDIQKGNTWKNGEKTCAQYDVKIKNTGAAITDWKAVITFDTTFKMTQIWGGEYVIDGKSLNVTAVDYTKNIDTNGEISFGFIGEFDSDPTATPQAKLYAGGKEVKTGGGLFGTAAQTGSDLVTTATATPKTQTAAPSGTPVQANGQLSVKGTQIVNKNGQPFVIKGVSTHGIAWFPQYVNADGFKTLRDTMGVNTVRLALYSSSNEGYTTQMHQKIDEGVKYATDLGMYVVIDWHVLGSQNPNRDKAAAEAFFKEMSTKYKNYNNVIYEICNEPNGDVQWERDIKPYAESMVKLIRANDNDAIIIIGTPTWSQDVDVVAKSPLQGSNLIYAFHFYAATHGAQYRDKVSSAVNAGLPVLVSEFGISEASGNGSVNTAEADKWMTFLNERNIGRICWGLCNKDEACAIIAPSCQKTSGWTDADLSQTGKWLKKSYTTN